jgi:hypothetical protein
MQVKIDQNGVLLIIPDSGLEVYALKKWAEENQEGRPRMVIELEEKIDSYGTK